MQRNRLFVVLAVVLALGVAPSVAGAAGDSEPSPKKDPNYTAATKAIEAGEFRRAIGLLDKVVGADPKNANALNYLGYSHRKLGNFKSAARGFSTL